MSRIWIGLVFFMFDILFITSMNTTAGFTGCRTCLWSSTISDIRLMWFWRTAAGNFGIYFRIVFRLWMTSHKHPGIIAPNKHLVCSFECGIYEIRTAFQTRKLFMLLLKGECIWAIHPYFQTLKAYQHDVDLVHRQSPDVCVYVCIFLFAHRQPRGILERQQYIMFTEQTFADIDGAHNRIRKSVPNAWGIVVCYSCYEIWMVHRPHECQKSILILVQRHSDPT